MSFSPHTVFCASTPSLRTFASSDRRRSASYSSGSTTRTAPGPAPPRPCPPVPLPTPVPPASLTMRAPSLGSDAVLPRPRPGRGAPPVDIAAVRVAPPLREQQPRRRTPSAGLAGRVKETLRGYLLRSKRKARPGHAALHPGVCAEWFW